MSVWDTTALPGNEQFGYWHEVICQAFVPLTPHRRGAVREFPARVETRPLAHVNRARLRAQPQRTDHGPRDVARTDGDHFFVNLQLAGRCATTVADTTAVVEPGQFVVVDTTEPYFFEFDRPWQMLSYRVPHSLFAAALHGRRLALGRPVDAAGAGAAVTALMTALWPLDPEAPGSDDLATAFATAVVAAATAPAEGDGVADRGRTAALPGAVTRAAILAHVRSRLGDRDLTVAGVCSRFAISPRTLHNLFADADESFAATVRRLRLERCAAILADPTSDATVSAVASAHGFDDPTSFGRAFRRRFGCSPREVRVRAR